MRRVQYLYVAVYSEFSSQRTLNLYYHLSSSRLFNKLAESSKLCFSIQMNISKSINLDYGERYEDMIDHRSYGHNLSKCETFFRL